MDMASRDEVTLSDADQAGTVCSQIIDHDAAGEDSDTAGLGIVMWGLRGGRQRGA